MMRRVRLLLWLVWLLLPVPVWGQAALMPDPLQQFFDSNGNPLSGGTLTFYQAGTTTPLSAYSDSGLSVALSNPLTLTSAGRTSTPVFLSSAFSYKILLKNSSGSTIWTVDNIAGGTYLATQAVQPAVQTTVSVGVLPDFALTCGSAPVCVLRVNNASDAIFAGFTPGSAGQRLIVTAVGSSTVFFAQQSATSTPAYRIIAPSASSIWLPLAAGFGTAEFVYDTSTARWRMVSYEQGAFIAYTVGLTPAAGSFTSASAAGRYYTTGRSMFVEITVTITTNGTAATNFTVGLPVFSGAAAVAVLAGTEVATTGIAATGYISPSSLTAVVKKYDGTYLGANGYVIVLSGSYELL